MQKKYSRFKEIKNFNCIKEKKKEKEEEILKGGKKEDSTELQKSNMKQRLIATVKSITEYTHKMSQFCCFSVSQWKKEC